MWLCSLHVFARILRIHWFIIYTHRCTNNMQRVQPHTWITSSVFALFVIIIAVVVIVMLGWFNSPTFPPSPSQPNTRRQWRCRRYAEYKTPALQDYVCVDIFVIVLRTRTQFSTMLHTTSSHNVAHRALAACHRVHFQTTKVLYHITRRAPVSNQLSAQNEKGRNTCTSRFDDIPMHAGMNA